MTDHDTIRLFIVEKEEEELPGHGMLPNVHKMSGRVVDVPISALKESVAEVTGDVAALVDSVPSKDKVQLDEVSVALQATADGGLRWFVGLGGSVGSTMTLTFRVKPAQS